MHFSNSSTCPRYHPGDLRDELRAMWALRDEDELVVAAAMVGVCVVHAVIERLNATQVTHSITHSLTHLTVHLARSLASFGKRTRCDQ